MLERTILMALLSTVIPAHAADVTYGNLPPGASSTNELTDVGAEICRDHLFDPSLVPGRLPDGYRLIRAAESAKEDPAVAGLIDRNARYRDYAVGSLCFVSVGSFVVDGVRVNPDGPTPMAFWWARAEGPRDPRMLGKVEWVQLASWYDRGIARRADVVASDPMARFVDMQVTPAGPGRWHMRMALADEVVEADVQGREPREQRKAPQPGFMSVPFSGDGAGRFWVTTYFGHHHRPATGTWRATGSGVFNDALAIPGESAVFATLYQDGWSALSGVYGAGP